MLAQDVRSGKLGGICTLSNLAASSAELGDLGGLGNGDAPADSHCDLCGLLGLVLPALPVASLPCDPGTQVADASSPAHLAESVPGLPFSRGPPAL